MSNSIAIQFTGKDILPNEISDSIRKGDTISMGNIKIESRNLLQADIIVCASTSVSSKIIRYGTWGDASHAMIYAGQDRVVDAVPGDGVREVTLSEGLTKDVFSASVYRHLQLTSEQRQKVVDSARKYLKREYDYVGAGGAGARSGPGATAAVVVCSIPLLGAAACTAGGGTILNNERKEKADEKFFCSELVAKAFEDAGAKLFDSEPSSIYPGMLLKSSTLRYVGHLRGA